MEFEITYEIHRDDYAEANAAFYRSSTENRITVWALLGASIVLVGLPLMYQQDDPAWRYPFFVAPFAAYLLYLAVFTIAPSLRAKFHYKQTKLAGEQYAAHFSPDEVRVSGKYLTWIHRWPSFLMMHESKNLFVFCDRSGILFIFAKRYFSDAQMAGLRELVRRAQTSGEQLEAAKLPKD